VRRKVYYLIHNLLKNKQIKAPKLKKFNIKLEGFPANYKIVQISDMHIGEFTNESFVRECVKIINAQKPDLVVLTGDIISQDLIAIQNEIDILSNLHAKDGIFAVLGNREVLYNDRNLVTTKFKSLGIEVLIDKSIKIDDKFEIIGIDDTKNNQKIIKHFNLPSLLISHQPKSVSYLKNFPNVKLMLCGHTHGGQIRPFGTKILKAQNQPFISGFNVYEGKNVYVNSGAGYTFLPIRFLSKSEITLFEVNF